MLKRSKELIQAYQQAPWRRQMQGVGFIAAGLVAISLVGALYLNITARAATAGRQVQNLQRDAADLEQKIEDLETQLAFITSVDTMQQRASDLGFSPVSPNAITYLIVPEYQDRPSGALLALPWPRFPFWSGGLTHFLARIFRANRSASYGFPEPK